MRYHLKFYQSCMETGSLPEPGLCACAKEKHINEDTLYLFQPTYLDLCQIEIDGHSMGFWGAGMSARDDRRVHCFTPLRQTIVLFMAAINNEL